MRSSSILILCLVVVAALFAAGRAMAWDAGPVECMHDPCSGGKNSATVLDTQPKYANSVISGRLADCPAGYHNIGIAGCGRAADSISTPSKLPDCPSGYKNIGPAGCVHGAKFWDTLGPSHFTCSAGYFLDKVVHRCHKTCPAGYTSTGETCFRGVDTKGPGSFVCGQGERIGGGLVANKCFPRTATNPGPCAEDREEYGVSGASLCFKKCPPGSSRTAVSTCAHHVKWRGNTHLFIVRNALELLKKESDPVAQRLVAAMTRQSCQLNWEQGVQDADNLDELKDNPSDRKGGGGTHFYNGSGKDAFGKPTKTVTYMVANIEANFKGNARQVANMRAGKAGNLNDAPSDAQCREIGYALHYLTDMTQPMHATAFSALEIPVMLHAALEEYVPMIQAGYPPVAPWDKRWKGMAPDQVFHETSARSGAAGPALMKTLEYNGTICTMNPETGAVYTGRCFLHDPNVNAALGTLLRDGYQSTASYLYALFNAHK